MASLYGGGMVKKVVIVTESTETTVCVWGGQGTCDQDVERTSVSIRITSTIYLDHIPLQWLHGYGPVGSGYIYPPVRS